MGRNISTGALTNAIATRDVNTGQLINVGGVNFKDAFTGNGAQTAFALTHAPLSGSDLVFVSSGSVSTYTISGTTLAFATAPANGASILASYEY